MFRFLLLLGAVCVYHTVYSAEVAMKNTNLRGADSVDEKSWVWTDDHSSETPTVKPTINDCDLNSETPSLKPTVTPAGTHNPTKKLCDECNHHPSPMPTEAPIVHTDSPR